MTNEELVVRFQRGDHDALEALYLQNTGLIEVIARKYQAYSEIDDLRQEAFFGLSRAAELWDPDRGGSFVTYLTYWLRQTMQRYVDDNGLTVRVPANQLSRMRQYSKMLTSYQMQFGRDPSDAELRYGLDLSQKQLDDLRKDVHALRIRSTEEVISGDDDDILLGDMIADDCDPISDAIERVQHEQMSKALWGEVDALPEREAEVIRDRWKHDHTLKECAASLGISPERVRQLEAKGMRKLRSGRSVRVLSAYLTDSGARSLGLRQTGLSAFRHNAASSVELAIMKLEQYEREREKRLLYG